MENIRFLPKVLDVPLLTSLSKLGQRQVKLVQSANDIAHLKASEALPQK